MSKRGLIAGDDAATSTRGLRGRRHPEELRGRALHGPLRADGQGPREPGRGPAAGGLICQRERIVRREKTCFCSVFLSFGGFVLGCIEADFCD